MPRLTAAPAVALETLDLQIGEKVYTIAPPDAATGVLLTNIVGLAMRIQDGEKVEDDARLKLVLDDKGEEDMMARILGPVLDEMKVDRVPWPLVKRANETAIAWIIYGDEAAAAVWSGKATAGNRKTRRSTRKAPRA